MSYKCLMCKGKTEAGKVNHIIDINGHIVIVKNVPALVCKQCGDYFLEHPIAVKIEKLLNEVEKNYAEIMVLNYFDSVAV